MVGLEYGKYKFTCRLNRAGILPAYKGSTVRGVFGIALKKVVCALKHQECNQCQLRQRCVYALVFETPIALPPPKDLRASVPPHPFVIEPPSEDKREYQPGEVFECALLLFGDTNRSLPYFIYAFEQIGRIGIGRRIEGRRAAFDLEKVTSNGDTIYSKKDDQMKLDLPAMFLRLPEQTAPSDEQLQVTVTLETPLRLKFKNKIRGDLPFHILARAMIRRISTLFICYVGAEPDLDYKGLLERAEQVGTVENSLKWHAWERYSNHQKQRMPLGGMVGEISYEGRLAEFLPLLDLCSKVHVGKNTSFGLGKMNCTWTEAKSKEMEG